MEKDAARCLGGVGDTPAFIVVPVSYDGTSHEHIVTPGVGSEGWATALRPSAMRSPGARRTLEPEHPKLGSWDWSGT